MNPNETNLLYLAGPDVFYPDPLTIGARKKAICADHGFTGHFPLDNQLGPQTGDAAFARAIGSANEDLMDACDAVIANMTPFRGVSMDVGTAFEMGYMRAQGKIVLGYINAAIPDYATRVAARIYPFDRPDWDIEDFGLTDNLMLENAIFRSSRASAAIKPTDDPYDLDAFVACVKHLAHMRS